MLRRIAVAQSVRDNLGQYDRGAAQSALRVNIEEERSTGRSFMSEGLEKQIDVPGMADLLAYLNSIK